MRSRPLLLLVGCSIAASAPGCFPHPDEDFQDYTDRTGTFRQGAVDAGPLDAVAPTVAVEGLYFGVCLSTLAAGRVDRVLRFYTQTKYTPDPAGGTGKITISLTAMKLGPGNTAPPTVSKDQTVGDTFTVTDAVTNAKGVYAAPLGKVGIPGAANPISGRDIVIEDVAVPGRFQKDKFCSQLSGHVVQPTDVVLDGAANTCVYFPVKEGDVPPELKLDRSDFPPADQGGCVLQ